MAKSNLHDKRSRRRFVYRFPYVRFHNNYYPLIPLSLKYKSREVNTFALLDSGASHSVFRPEIAQALGILHGRRAKVRLGTASGRVHLEFYRLAVEVEKTKFNARVGFSKEAAANFNIIGRQGFFPRFSVIFHEIAKTVILVPVRR